MVINPRASAWFYSGQGFLGGGEEVSIVNIPAHNTRFPFNRKTMELVGDGFTNILVPTQAVIVGALAMAVIPYDRWLRFIMPFMVKIWIVGSIALAVAVLIGYS